MITMTRPSESIALSCGLLLAFELGQRSWKLGFTVGFGQRPRIRQIPAGAVDVLMREITAAKKKLGLPPDSPVISCYEAGREGFWLHRYLTEEDARHLPRTLEALTQDGWRSEGTAPIVGPSSWCERPPTCTGFTCEP